MKTAKQPVFRLSLLALALSAGTAYAHTETEVAQDLPAVKVNAGKGQITNNYKANATRNVSSVRDVLADRADINVGGGSLAAQYLTIRGAGQNRIDLVVDGTNTDTQTWYHQGRFQLDPQMIKVIGVDKGAGSASAGIGIVNGAVRASTVEAKDFLKDGQTFGGRVGAEINSNKGVGGNLALYGQANGFDGLVMGSWLNNQDYKAGSKNGSSAVVENSARKQGNYLAKFGYAINSDHKVGLSYRHEHYFGDSAERPEFALANMQRGPLDTYQKTTNLDYQGKNLGFVSKVDANIYHLKLEDKRNAWYERFDAKKKTQDKFDGIRHSNTITMGVNTNFTSNLPGDHKLKYGVNLRNEETNSRDSKHGFVNGEHKKEYGVYAEGIWSFDPITITTGLRYDHFDLDTTGTVKTTGKKKDQVPVIDKDTKQPVIDQTTGSPKTEEKDTRKEVLDNNGQLVMEGNRKASKGVLNPSISAVWNVNDHFSLNAKLNYASRSPVLASANTLTDNARKTFERRGLRVVNPDLKVERARLAEIGFEYDNHGLNLKGNVFHQEVHNFYSGINDTTITNKGKVTTTGYELDASYRWNNLTARLAMAYANPKADFNISNDALDIVPQGRKWVTGLSYHIEPAHLELGWRGRFAEGKSYNTGSLRQHRVGYGVHDVYANWAPVGDDLNVNFAINNITNKHYVSHSQRGVNGGTRGTLATPAAQGREFRLGVNYRF